MKKTFLKKSVLILPVFLLGMLTACIRTDYKSAAEFPPLSKDMKVVTYYDKSQFPAAENEQILVGDATASAYSSSYTLNDIKQKLIRMARSHGANAVLIQTIDHKVDGQVRTDQVKNMSAPTWTPVDDSSTDAQQQRYMDLYSRAKDGELPVYKITIKAQFYKLPERLLPKENLLLPDSDTPPPLQQEREKPARKENTIRIQNN